MKRFGMIWQLIVFTVVCTVGQTAETEEKEEVKKDFGENLSPVTKGLIIDHNYPDDPKQFYKNFIPHKEVSDANRKWKRDLGQDRDHFDFVMSMLTMPHSVPINPRQLAMEYDHLPATNYIWVIVAYNSSNVAERKASMALAKAASNYFYERCIVGKLDLSYPSNAATFANGSTHSVVRDTPSLLIKFPQTDHQAVPTQNVGHPHVEVGHIEKWGYTIPGLVLKENVETQFKLIIDKYWNNLESYYKLHAIYSHYYHDPRKEAVQEAIEHFDEDLHDEIYERALNEFNLRPDTKKFADFMLTFQYHEKAESKLKKYLNKQINLHVSQSFQRHRKDKMHLVLQPQQLPDLSPFIKRWNNLNLKKTTFSHTEL